MHLGRPALHYFRATPMHKITTLDDHWMGRPRSIGTALLESDGHRAIVDPGPGSTLDTLRKELGARGVSVDDLDAILLTHIHLDHAGSTGALVKENPRVAVYVHKLGAPHMIDPAKLLASAARLWPDNLGELFGEMLPVAESHLRILEGGESITLGSRKIEVAYTPGHASHHVSYFDSVEGVAFVGDTTGIRIEGHSYVMPATPPPDIDLRLWDSSFATILERQPKRLFLTHFGFSEDPAAHIAEFRERLHRWMETTEKILQTAKSDSQAMDSFMAAMRAEIGEHLPAKEVEQYVATAGLNLSFLGLARHARKRAQAS
jgi:glyoxylase-like metal-dependent hydrolase (beta-lactamase superfamily II)